MLSKDHCTMQLSPCKCGNQRFESIFYHSPHFPPVSLFQTEYLGEYLSSVSLSFYFHACNKLKHYEASSSESLQCYVQGRVEWLIKKTQGEATNISQFFSDENGGETIWEIFAPRTAAWIKLLFSSFFPGTASLLNTQNFRVIRPAVHVFCK